MSISSHGERAPAAVDPTLTFIKRELAPSPERWTGGLVFAGLAMLGVIATVTFRIPGIGFRRHLASKQAAS
jgi:hypothetical protein